MNIIDLVDSDSDSDSDSDINHTTCIAGISKSSSNVMEACNTAISKDFSNSSLLKRYNSIASTNASISVKTQLSHAANSVTSSELIDLVDDENINDNNYQDTEFMDQDYDYVTGVLTCDDDGIDDVSWKSQTGYYSDSDSFSYTSSVKEFIGTTQQSQSITTIQKSTQNASKKTRDKLVKVAEKDIKDQVSGKWRLQELNTIFSESLSSNQALINAVNSLFMAYDKTFPGVAFKDSFVENVIRWTFRPKSLGGMANIGDRNSVVLPFAVVQFSSTEFVRLCFETSDGIEFEALEKALLEIKSMLCTLDGCPSNCRVSFLLFKEDEEILKFRKKNPTRKFKLDNVIAYLLQESQIDLVFSKSFQDIAEYLHACMRTLTKLVYPKNETSFDNALKLSKLKSSDEMTLEEKENFKLTEVWIAMLQQIPMLSRAKATSFAKSREGFSCPRKLLDTYNNPLIDINQKKFLAAPLFSKNSREVKLSRELYSLFTNMNPNTLLDE